jgi:hypothetical protein
MVPALFISALVAAAPLKIASTGFTGVGVEPARAQFYGQHFAQQLAAGDALRVITPQDAKAVLGLERQKQLLGCSSDGQECLVGLAGALGAQAILSGAVAKVGATLSATVKIIDSTSTRALFATAVEAPDEEALLAALNEAARQARVALGVQTSDAPLAPKSLGGKPVAATTTEVRGAAPAQDWRPFTLLGAGLVSVGVGAVFFAQAIYAQRKLDGIERDPELPTGSPASQQLVKDAQTAAQQGETNLAIGWALTGVGAALMAGGVIWLALEPSSDTTAVVVPMPGGAAVSVAGHF